MANLIKKFISAAFAVLFSLSGYGQDISSRIAADPEYSGCFYRNYPVPEGIMQTKASEGYVPFYISHYGRHGSRWVSDGEIYDRTLALMEKAGKCKALSQEGKELLEELRFICKDAEGRAGELSAQGSEEHRGIAGRMYLNWPEVFSGKNGKPARIDSRATVYTRCIFSMTAFDERLKESDPQLQISRNASKRDLHYMADYSHTGETYEISLQVSDSLAKVWIRPDRFLAGIFSDKEFIRDISSPQNVMLDLFHITSDLQAVGLQQLDLYRYFTGEELYTLWKVLSIQTYIEEGPSTRFGKGNMENAQNLLQNIVSTADAVISGEKEEAATLRFGHESNIVPLMCLIGLKETDFRPEIEAARKAASTSAWSAELETAARLWNIAELCPMATNIQFIFFHNDKGRIKVRVLHNEKDAQLPVEGAPFYDWTVLKSYLLGRIRN